MWKQTQLSWSERETPEELRRLLVRLGEEYPIRPNGEGRRLVFCQAAAGCAGACWDGDHVRIEYGTVTDAARAIGSALSRLETKEKTEFRLLGIMLDCSRNGVMTVPHVKKWLRRLALMGYNTAMLYTEDTYRLPGEPYFGYMRGAYTAEEVREIDAYAADLGIEIIGCIQTLGHLEQVIKWGGAYQAVTDTARVLLVDEEKTYRLIDKMIRFWSDNLKSRRIHIGMDETHDLGRGRFMDRHGYERGFEIFNRHLAKVNEICGRYDMRAMIWSDMYFRMGNEDLEYYDVNCNIPPEVRAQIPENVDLVYWDYYHEDQAFYERFIRLHRDLERPVLLGSGIWTWSKMWLDYQMTRDAAGPCLRACKATGLRDLFFTMWGDDGSYCDWDSAFVGLSWAADVAYGMAEEAPESVTRFEAICQASYLPQVEAGKLDPRLPYGTEGKYHYIRNFILLWDDPIMGIGWNGYKILDEAFDVKVETAFSELIDKLLPYQAEKNAGNVAHAIKLAQAIVVKLRLRRELLSAYERRDMARLRRLAEVDIPAAIAAYRAVFDSCRDLWLATFKPFGLETIQMRNGTMIVRYEELARRLSELIAGKVAAIPELEEKLDAGIATFPAWTRGVMCGSTWW